MTIRAQDFQLFAGESVALCFSIVDAEGNPLTLETGCALEWSLAPTNHDVEPLLFKSLSNGGILVQDTVAEVYLSRLDTADLLPGKIYYHQLALSSLTIDADVLAVGSAWIKRALPLPNASTGGGARIALTAMLSANAVIA
jgi:hypothetical protein